MNVLVTGANSYLGGWVVHELRQAKHNLLGTNSHGGFLFSHGLVKEDKLDAVVHLAWRAKVGNSEEAAQNRCLDHTRQLVDSLRRGREVGWPEDAGEAKAELMVTQCPRCLGHGKYDLLLRRGCEHQQHQTERCDPCDKCQGTGKVTLTRSRGNLPKIIFASTASVYASSQHSPARNELTQPAPSCAYTWAKFKAEEYIRESKLLHAILRLGSLFGVGANGGRTPSGTLHYVPRTKVAGLMVNAFAAAALTNGTILVWHPGCWRPVLHVRDAAEIIRQAVEAKDVEGTLNVAHCAFRAGDCAQLVRDILGSRAAAVERSETPNEVQVEVVKAPPGSSGHSVRLDCSRLERLLPGRKMRTVREGVLEIKRWLEAGGRDADEMARWQR